MQSSSRAVAALRRSARKNRGAWSSLQQQFIKALPTSSGDVERQSDSKPVLKYPEDSEKTKKGSACKALTRRDVGERGLICKGTAFGGTEYDGALSPNLFLKCNLGCKQASNVLFLNSSTIARRHFASKSKGGDDDEDVLDDFESRLMGADYEGDDMYTGASSYGMGAENFEDYGEWEKSEGDSEMEEDAGDGERTEEGSDDEDDSSDEDFANEQSDEDFEDERTDEELDELLANTPLFEPPELPEFLQPDQREPEFSFRPEGPMFYPGMEYEPEDLDITRPLPPKKREQRPKEEISVQEVIDKADFRNVRYLTKFISETGTIIARKEFKMRTKSHNRVVKAIKTARLFGLMPYSNMGRPKFVFNVPFDESSEFYSTDEDEEQLQNAAAGMNYQRRFGNYDSRGGNYFGRGFGGQKTGQGWRGGNYFGQGGLGGQNTGQGWGGGNYFGQGGLGGQNTGQSS